MLSLNRKKSSSLFHSCFQVTRSSLHNGQKAHNMNQLTNFILRWKIEQTMTLERRTTLVLCRQSPLKFHHFHLTRSSKQLFLQDLRQVYQNRSERHLTVFESIRLLFITSILLMHDLNLSFILVFESYVQAYKMAQKSLKLTSVQSLSSLRVGGL